MLEFKYNCLVFRQLSTHACLDQLCLLSLLASLRRAQPILVVVMTEASFTRLVWSRCMHISSLTCLSLLSLQSFCTSSNHPRVSHLRACYILTECTYNVHSIRSVHLWLSSPSKAPSCSAKTSCHISYLSHDASLRALCQIILPHHRRQ